MSRRELMFPPCTPTKPATASLRAAVDKMNPKEMLQAIEKKVACFTGEGSNESNEKQFSALHRAIRVFFRFALPGGGVCWPGRLSF